MTQTDATAFLMSAGAPSFKWGKTPGTTIRGTILDLQMQQQRDPQKQTPKFWDDGNPMMQLRVTLQTDLRDPEINDDDGKRCIYVKGAMQGAVRDAIKAAGASAIEVGGMLSVRFESYGPKATAAFEPPRLYRAKYEAPVPAAVAVDDL